MDGPFSFQTLTPSHSGAGTRPAGAQPFETPLSDEQYAADSARADRCLEQHGAKWVRSYFSTDQRAALARLSRLTLDQDLDSIVGHVTEFVGRLRADMDGEEVLRDDIIVIDTFMGAEPSTTPDSRLSRHGCLATLRRGWASTRGVDATRGPLNRSGAVGHLRRRETCSTLA